MEAIRALLGAREADHSAVGIGLAAVSLLVMPFLSFAQRRAGREYGSASAVADSKQIAALAIAAVAVKEGREAWRGDACCTPAAALTTTSESDVDSCGCGDGRGTNDKRS